MCLAQPGAAEWLLIDDQVLKFDGRPRLQNLIEVRVHRRGPALRVFVTSDSPNLTYTLLDLGPA